MFRIFLCDKLFQKGSGWAAISFFPSVFTIFLQQYFCARCWQQTYQHQMARDFTFHTWQVHKRRRFSPPLNRTQTQFAQLSIARMALQVSCTCQFVTCLPSGFHYIASQPASTKKKKKKKKKRKNN